MEPMGGAAAKLTGAALMAPAPNTRCRVVYTLDIQNVAPPAPAAAGLAQARPPRNATARRLGSVGGGGPGLTRSWPRLGAAVACTRRPAIGFGGVVAGRLGSCARCGGRWNHTLGSIAKLA